MTPMLIDPVDKVVLAQSYHVKEWLRPGLEALVARAGPITFEVAGRIGFETALKITAIRECCVLVRDSRGYNSTQWEVSEKRGEIPVSIVSGRVRATFQL